MEATANKAIAPNLKSELFGMLDEIMTEADKVCGFAEAADLICATDSIGSREERVFSLYGSALREIAQRQNDAAKACYSIINGAKD